jgi:hypothetical protein
LEEDAAYIVDRQGRLYQVELAAGRKRLLAQIPRPAPAEVGFPGLVLPSIVRVDFLFSGIDKAFDVQYYVYKEVY